MNIKESEIRTNLAKYIDALDPMLNVVKEEHYISFADGRKAFIDILAKDKFGCYTIIEIKKSNKSARTTTQQLYKYASFFKEKYQVENSQIRCVVVSTHWNELNAPFSEFKQFSDYEVKGYQINYIHNKKPLLKEVDPVFVVGDNKPLSSIYCFKFRSKEIRDENIVILKGILEKINSLNYVIFPLHVFDGKEGEAKAYSMEEFPYAIAWVVFSGNKDGVKLEIDDLIISSELDDEFGFLSMWESNKEISILRTRIVILYLKLSENLGFFKGYAIHTLNNLFGICDFDAPLIYNGPMFDDGLYSEGEIIDMSNGINGLHPYIYISKMSPVRVVNFNTTRQDVNKFLSHNQRWNVAINEILISLEDKDIIEFEIYNPLNILGYLNDLCVDGKSTRLPYAKVRVTRENGEIDEYYGLLLCEKDYCDSSPLQAILNSYPDKNTFRSRSVVNTLTEYDEKLSSILGLSYGFFHLNEGKVFSSNQEVWVECDIQSMKTIQDFIHINIDFVREVGELYRKWEIGIGNANNMVMFDE